MVVDAGVLHRFFVLFVCLFVRCRWATLYPVGVRCDA